MRLLRLFVAGPPRAAPGDVLPHPRRTGVPAVSPPTLQPLSAYALAHLQHHSDNPDSIPTTPRCSPRALFRSTLPLKSTAHVVRRKRRRLSPRFLIEDASVRYSLPPQESAPRRFRPGRATNRERLCRWGSNPHSAHSLLHSTSNQREFSDEMPQA